MLIFTGEKNWSKNNWGVINRFSVKQDKKLFFQPHSVKFLSQKWHQSLSSESLDNKCLGYKSFLSIFNRISLTPFFLASFVTTHILLQLISKSENYYMTLWPLLVLQILRYYFKADACPNPQSNFQQKIPKTEGFRLFHSWRLHFSHFRLRTL